VFRCVEQLLEFVWQRSQELALGWRQAQPERAVACALDLPSRHG
jgi:hypothetical protein